MSRERNLAELLAPDRLSGAEREDVLANVLGTVEAQAPRPAWWRRASRLGPLSVAAVAATVALMLVARHGRNEAGSAPVVKGSGAAGAPLIEIDCVGGTLGRCPRGSTLVFRIDGLQGPGALAAWADPVGAGAPGRQRVWYFSADDRSPPLGRSGGAPLVVRQGISVGGEHGDGAYDVHVLLTAQPLSRAEALSPVRPRARAETVVRLQVAL